VMPIASAEKFERFWLTIYRWPRTKRFAAALEKHCPEPYNSNTANILARTMEYSLP
jgi:hypothetical protein